LAQYLELRKYPHPLSVIWLRGLRPFADLVDIFEAPRHGAMVLLLLAGLFYLGRIHNPRWQLLKPEHENPGKGMQSHLDFGRLGRAALVVAITFWLLGLLAPLALLPSREDPLRGIAFALLGGIPNWMPTLLPFPLVPLVESLLLLCLLWLLWGAGGPLSRERELPAHEVLRWGLAAGAGAYPALLLLTAGPVWLAGVGGALSLSDRAEWQRLLAVSVFLPVFGFAYLAGCVYLFRPRIVTQGRFGGVALLSLGVLAGGMSGAYAMDRILDRYDAGGGTLAQKLKLNPSPLGRFALVLTPRGFGALSITEDGSTDPRGVRIACNGESVKKVEAFLTTSHYRSQLALTAYRHLKTCTYLDWLSPRSMELDLAMLQAAPNAEAAQSLMEKLAECPITPETRRVLDQFADDTRLRWDDADLHQWLGAAYARFGEIEKARRHLDRASMSREERDRILTGEPLLTNGTIRGRMTLAGKPENLMRIGLVRAERWLLMRGIVRPEGWRVVLAATYTNRQGRFEFKNVPEGRYVLVMTGGQIGRLAGRPTITNNPGAIEISGAARTQDLGSIDVRLQPGRPRPGPGETMTRGTVRPAI
jgi:hypothetical protein